jgi:RNA polymerase sigma-70 factor (ECF subfamily)
MRLHLARADARFTDTGDLVRLADQDRSLWDHDAMAKAVTLIERAAAMGRPGPYQVEAAIAACHAEAPSFGSTDWMQVVALYDLLLEMEPSPVVRPNRALAIWRVAGAQAALRELDRLAAELDGYHIYHAARGELLSEMGRNEQARAARHRQPIGRQLPYQVVSRGRLGWVSAAQLVFIDTVSVRRCPSWSAGSGTGVARGRASG